jgi:small-conductance mechanosensitive channel
MTPETWTPLLVGGSIAASLVIVGPLVQFVLRRARRTTFAADLRQLRWPVRLFALALTARSAELALDRQPATALSKALLIIAVAWVAVRGLVVAQGVVFRRLHIDDPDNLRARSRRTQIELIRRVVSVIVVVGALAVMLLSLTPLGREGPTIVAYAGVIGILGGVALRSSIENLAAGVVIAFSEPIRLDDVVVVEGEWGRIEHIGLMNVSVHVWDDRRLVLPTSRFVNEPFENWTRNSSAVTGSVTAWLDYGADVDDLRRVVGRFLASSPPWDRRFYNVQVVDLGASAMQVRILVTAANAGDLWELRCAVREALLPHISAARSALPVVRVRSDDRAGDSLREPVGA